MSFFKRYKMFISLILGVLIGLVFKEKALVLKPIGTIFVNMIFVVVVPLVFLSITKSISAVNDLKKIKKILIKSLLVFSITLSITGVFTVLSATIVNPYDNSDILIEEVEEEKINITDELVKMLSVEDFSELFSKSNILAIIIFSIIIGICVNRMKERKQINYILNLGYKIIIQYLNLIMYIAPFGIVSYLASLIGQYGSTFIIEYARILIIYIILGILNILIFHTLYLYIVGKKELVITYYKNIFDVVITAFSTQSSVITMPVNMKLMKKMNVSDNIINICTPYATIINMQGNVIQNILKIFLLFSLFHVSMGGILNYIGFIALAIFAGMITGGVPGGGVVSNTILVNILNFPSSALPILITIEWILDAPATVFNVLSDSSTLPLVDKIVKRK